MSREAIVHLFGWDKKFFLPFRDLIHEHFADGRHSFIVYGDVEQDSIPPSADTATYRSLLKNFLVLSKALYLAEKVILHGLFSSHLLYILVLQPWLLKKCHWVIWGGDLYAHEAESKDWRWKKNEFFRRHVIRRLGYLLTYIPGDAELARQWYGAKGKHLECLMYPSNVMTPVDLPEVEGTTPTVLIGNSADPSNNHFEIFELLQKSEDKNFKLICPISYGNQDYAGRVATEGRRLFGDKFEPLLNFMSPQDYLRILATIDIAIFAHRRQQGMGSTIALLGLGKKVYMRDEVSSSKMLKSIGFHINSFSDFNLMAMDRDSADENKKLAKSYFSQDRLLDQLKIIFNN